jgi:hypothetical protein
VAGRLTEIIDLYSTWPVITIDPSVTLAATRIEKAHRVSFCEPPLIADD